MVYCGYDVGAIVPPFSAFFISARWFLRPAGLFIYKT
nr:MAG TPA: hypothetical protein [Caudoviricetes sp.]